MAVKLIPKTKSAYSSPLLIKNLIQSSLIRFPDQEIIYRDIMRYDYRTLYKRIAQLANLLESIGIKSGDTIAVMDWDSHRYLESFMAVPMMGAVLHTINIRLSPEQLVYTINHAEDDVILVNAEFLPLLEAVKDQLQTVKKIILINDEKKAPKSSLEFVGEYEELMAQQEDVYDFPDFDENTMATTFYTTGTTGLPKGVYFSHRQLVLLANGLLHAACSQHSQININSSDVYMPLTPMFHVHAWAVPYLATLIGLKQVYPGKYEPETILKLVIGEKVTFSHCVPTIIHMLVNSPIIKSIDLSHWSVIIGGSALPRGLCKAALQHKINVTTAYGMSETGPFLTMAHLKPYMLDWSIEDQIAIRCKAGIPAAGVEMRLVNEKGDFLPHDGKSAGEIVVRGSWITQGYVKNPEKSEELWRNGWLHTEDIGVIDTEGYLQITDRTKDVIKTGGEWLSSLELEDIASQHEAVSEVAVIGIADEKWGERPLVLIVLKDEFKGKVTDKDIESVFKKHVEDGVLPKYGIPSKIMFVDDIPKTSVGKFDKKEIRSRFR